MGRFKGLIHDTDRGEPKQPRKAKPAAAEPPPAKPATAEPAPTAAKSRGRPKGSGKGKRSSRDFMQAGAYVRRATHRDVMIELMRDGKKQDFSDLVESLLEEWLKGRK